MVTNISEDLSLHLKHLSSLLFFPAMGFRDRSFWLYIKYRFLLAKKSSQCIYTVNEKSTEVNTRSMSSCTFRENWILSFQIFPFLELVKTLCSTSVLKIVGKCEGSKHGPEMKKLKLTLWIKRNWGPIITRSYFSFFGEKEAQEETGFSGSKKKK